MIRPWLVLAWLWAGSFIACATVTPADATREARQAGARGDAAASARAARLVVAHGPAAGTVAQALEDAGRGRATVEGAVWEATLLEATGATAEARARWMALATAEGAPAAVVAHAARRLSALVDRVPIQPRDLATALVAQERPGDGGLALARWTAALAVRLSDDAALERAHQRLGSVRAYRSAGRRSERPVLGAAPPLLRPARGAARADASEAARVFGDRIETRGVIAPPRDGPGLYVVAVELPAAEVVEVDVIGEPAVRAYADGVQVADHPRWTEPLGRALRFRVHGARTLELQLAARGPGPTVEVLARAAAPEVATAATLSSLAARVIRLARAVADADWAVAQRVRASLDPAAPVLAWLMARSLRDDETRPPALRRARAQGLLSRAIEAAPALAAARAELVSGLVDDGDIARAAGIVDGGPLAEWDDWVRWRLAALDGAVSDGLRHARRLRERLPASCAAAEAWLETAWEELQLTIAIDGRRGRASATPKTWPGCLELGLRRAQLLIEAWQLDPAASLLAELQQRAPPGPRRARVTHGLGRVALAKGQWDEALALGWRTVAEGAEHENGLLLALSAARLKGDRAEVARIGSALLTSPHVSMSARRHALDPSRDLGLPLADGYAVARRAHDDVAASGADGSIEILLDERHTRVFPDGALVHRAHRIVRLWTTDAIERFGEIGLPEEAEILLARTWKPTPGGDLQPIEPESFVEKSSISLPALAVGAITEVAWVWMEGPDATYAPSFEAPPFHFASADGPTRRARLVVRAPPEMALDIIADPDVAAPEQASPGVLVFEATDVPRVIEEPLDPRPDRRLAAVTVASRDLEPHIVTRMRDAVAMGIKRAAAVQAMADRVAPADGAAPLDRLRRLHASVLQVQASDQSVLRANASHAVVASTGERATLLTALCRAAGLQCDLFLVRPWSYGAVHPRRLELGTYTYPVVRATVAEGDIWLDVGNRWVPFDYLPPLVQRASAIGLTGGPTRILTGGTEEAEGRRGLTVAVTVDEGGGGFTATGEDHLTGVFAMSWRQALTGMTPAGRRRALSRVAQQTLPGASVAITGVEALVDRDRPLVVRWSASGATVAAAGGASGLTLGLSPERLARSTIVVPTRASPLLVNRASRLDMTVTVSTPPGLALGEAPAPLSVRHPLLSLDQRAEQSPGGRRLTATKTFRLRAGIVAPEAYDAWKEAVRAVERSEVLHVVLTPTVSPQADVTQR